MRQQCGWRRAIVFDQKSRRQKHDYRDKERKQRRYLLPRQNGFHKRRGVIQGLPRRQRAPGWLVNLPLICASKTLKAVRRAWRADEAALRANRDGLGQIGIRFGRVCDYGTANFEQIGNFVTVKTVTVLPNKITAIV